MSDNAQPDVDRLRHPTPGASEWEHWRSIAGEIEQLEFSAQGIAAMAESLHRFQVQVSHLGWTNDLGNKLTDAENLAKRCLSIIESLRRFTN